MKKRVLTGLLTMVMAFSVFTPAFATDDLENPAETVVSVNEEPTVVAEETAETEATEAEQGDDALDAPLDDATEQEDAQVYTIPILRNKEASSDNQAVSLMGTGDGPIITGAYTENFYADSNTFEIMLYVDNFLDTRQKMKLSVVDENNVVIAQQTGVYYRDSSLVYQMKLVKAVEPYAEYSIQFSYTGKYNIAYDIHDAYVWVESGVAIKNVEVINYATNSFRIELANATPGTQYTLFYVENGTDASVKKDATVTSDKALYVEFGDTVAFDPYNNSIYLCHYGSTSYSYSNTVSSTYLYYFDLGEAGGEISNEGVNCNSYISTSDTQTWVYLYEKGFGYQRYEASDVSKVKVSMFDMTTGKTVGTSSNLAYDATYGEIDGYVTFNTKLDETHKYLMVFNDGYSLRVYDDFVVTSKPTLANINAYDLNKKYLQIIPMGTTSFYVYVNSFNISDRNNIKVELLDSADKVVATSTYSGTSRYYLMTAQAPLAAGEYTIKATYGDLTETKTISVSASAAGSIWQYVFERIVYNGKTYFGVALQSTTLNPANLTYKVALANGTEKTATYHRPLYTDGDSTYFVVVVNEELSDVNYQNKATFEIYQGSNLIVPTYPNNVMISWVNETSEPFVYGEYNVTDTTVELFLEGFSGVGTFTVCGYDDLTQTGVSVNAARSTNNSVTFNKSDLKKISILCPLSSEYGGYRDKELYIENNGEYLSYIWASPYDGFVNAVLDDTFGFQKEFTERTYEVLNLPYKTYAYYRLASSESELASKPYQKIEVGLLYQLKNMQGTQTVYAQFKTAGGVESAVQNASISTDTKAPTFTILNSIPEKLLVNDADCVVISINVTADEAGKLYFVLYDKDGNQIGYNHHSSVPAGTSSATGYFWLDDYNFEDATKLVVYMEDSAGNKSPEQSFNISVLKQFSEYTSGETYVKINNETGAVVEARSTGTSIRIPAQIDGVAVTSIDEYAFVDNGEEVSIFIPESVTNINAYAFSDLSNFTLLVKEGSAAHDFAVDNDLTYTIPVVDLGDVNGDEKVNGRDAIALQRFVLFRTPLDFPEAADVNYDTKTNGKDAIAIQRFVLFKTPF